MKGIAARYHPEFYLLLFTCTLAMMFLTSAVHLLSIYVALELSSYSLYVLVSLRRTRDQAVAAARRRTPAAAAFVNAVLRRFLREREARVAAALQSPVAAWNHPAWWIEQLQHYWPEHWPALLAAESPRADPPYLLAVALSP